MSIGSAFSFIQLNTSQASIFSQYMQRLCGVAFKGSVSTDHAVTHVLGNSSPFRLYCSAFHPRRNLWRDQSLRAGEGRERLQKLHSWMAELNRELEGKYTYVQSIGIRCDDLRQAHDTIARRLKPSDGSLRWLTPRTIGLYLPNVLGDLQLCFTDDDEGLIPFRELLERPDERNNPGSLIEPEEGGIDGVDHIAIALAHGTLAHSRERLEELLGWENFRLFDPEDVGHELNAVSVRPKGQSAILTLVQSPNETNDERDSKGHVDFFQTTRNARSGRVNAHHIAFSTRSLLKMAIKLKSLGAWDPMPGPPSSYYDALPPNVRSCYGVDELRMMERLGIMVDRGAGEACAILQIFHRFVNDTPDLLVEFIERTPAEDSDALVTPVGCGGLVTTMFAICLTQRTGRWDM